jgi:hypothetical protein
MKEQALFFIIYRVPYLPTMPTFLVRLAIF